MISTCWHFFANGGKGDYAKKPRSRRTRPQAGMLSLAVVALHVAARLPALCRDALAGRMSAGNAQGPRFRPWAFFLSLCGSCRIRTCGPGLKRPLLYRAELTTLECPQRDSNPCRRLERPVSSARLDDGGSRPLVSQSGAVSSRAGGAGSGALVLSPQKGYNSGTRGAEGSHRNQCPRTEALCYVMSSST